jgi:hypothetical protein
VAVRLSPVRCTAVTVGMAFGGDGPWWALGTGLWAQASCATRRKPPRAGNSSGRPGETIGNPHEALGATANVQVCLNAQVGGGGVVVESNAHFLPWGVSFPNWS